MTEHNKKSSDLNSPLGAGGNTEISRIIGQMRETYEGSPWFGRNAKALLGEVEPGMVAQKPAGQHSLLELLWHMNTWKEFTISRLRPGGKDLDYFEANDWQVLDHNDDSLWQQGVDRFHALHGELIEAVQEVSDSRLNQPVAERNYNYRQLLYGIVQHEIYHLGQIAYLVKMLRK